MSEKKIIGVGLTINKRYDGEDHLKSVIVRAIRYPLLCDNRHGVRLYFTNGSQIEFSMGGKTKEDAKRLVRSKIF